jgi:hypothetical protein
MATGLPAAAANAILDGILSGGTPFIKLHVGDPGAAGTSNPATETTRKAVTCSGASGGTETNDNALSWTSVAGTEDYTHFTIWDDVSAGSFKLSGTITAAPVTATDNFTIPIGDLDFSISTAA